MTEIEKLVERLRGTHVKIAKNELGDIGPVAVTSLEAADTIERLLAALKGAEGALANMPPYYLQFPPVEGMKKFRFDFDWLNFNEEGSTITEQKERAEKAEAERDAAVAALKPFADAADHMEKCRDERPLWIALNTGWSQREHVPLTVGHLRQARAALGPTAGGGNAQRQ